MQYFDKYEADLVLKDVTNTFREDVLERFESGNILGRATLLLTSGLGTGA